MQSLVASPARPDSSHSFLHSEWDSGCTFPLRDHHSKKALQTGDAVLVPFEKKTRFTRRLPRCLWSFKPQARGGGRKTALEQTLLSHEGKETSTMTTVREAMPELHKARSAAAWRLANILLQPTKGSTLPRPPQYCGWAAGIPSSPKKR